MSSKLTLPLRIVLAEPPPGVLYCLQRTTRADCVDHRRSDGSDVVFEVTIQVRDNSDPPDYRGPFILGPRGERHIAILIGTLAGDMDSCWTRGCKIKLGAITRSQIDEVCSSQGTRLLGRFEGTSRKSGPSCATVKFVDEGWRVDRSVSV